MDFSIISSILGGGTGVAAIGLVFRAILKHRSGAAQRERIDNRQKVRDFDIALEGADEWQGSVYEHRRVMRELGIPESKMPPLPKARKFDIPLPPAEEKL